ncbi:uncharacterized protein LAESUDRAFT_725448 [Laetiporus sulphureus 93-53]|uniref:Uncharacterized protein n=1 Tax=Laetiporus sulphureus 93-53 TaxID=1314785 RepID=A0A165EHX9_9APHY|nr:uncharacterized protein LAESUDRAFT_725448 [Laetiporus sulphureus 93-53]KZT07085.1 hypothetical protein LAESUDRAFT_725448 [Laetiporus sulphureus 93-53]
MIGVPSPGAPAAAPTLFTSTCTALSRLLQCAAPLVYRVIRRVAIPLVSRTNVDSRRLVSRWWLLPCKLTCRRNCSVKSSLARLPAQAQQGEYSSRRGPMRIGSRSNRRSRCQCEPELDLTVLNQHPTISGSHVLHAGEHRFQALEANCCTKWTQSSRLKPHGTYRNDKKSRKEADTDCDGRTDASNCTC